MLTYVFAVLAACANAVSSVLQRKANRQVPQRDNLSLRLIGELLRKPVWFGGILAIIAGFLLQASALGTGKLAVVEPILVLELPATLILASRVFRSPMHCREWATALAMTAGLAGLLYFLSPSAGRTASVPWSDWVTGMGVNLAFVAAMVAWGRRGPAGQGASSDGSSARQAAVLGVAGGSAFGLTAALMKGMTNTFSSGGFASLLTSWELYAMIAAGMLGMFLVQSALNAGRLLAAQPGLTLSDPIVSILWGVLVFGENVRGGWFIALAIVSGLIMASAVLVLARSPLLSDELSGPPQGLPEEASRPARDVHPGGAHRASAARAWRQGLQARSEHGGAAGARPGPGVAGGGQLR